MSAITETSYKLIERPETELYCVMLTTPPWDGVVVQYGKVGLKVNEDKECATLIFSFTILENPDSISDAELSSSEVFKTHLGDILQHIIQTALDSGNYSIGNGDNKPTDDSSTALSQ